MAATVKGLAAARLAETGSWRTEGDRSAAHQLARRTGTSVVQAEPPSTPPVASKSLPDDGPPPPAGASCRPSRRAPSPTRLAANTAAEHDCWRMPAAPRWPSCGSSAPGPRPRRRSNRRGPPPPHPPTPARALLHRRRGRVAPPLPQQPRSRRPHHGRSSTGGSQRSGQARPKAATSPPTPTPPTPWPRCPSLETDRSGAGRDVQGHRADRPGALAAGLCRSRARCEIAGFGPVAVSRGAGHDRHRRPVPDRGGHPGREGGGGGPSGAAAQRLAADGAAVALPELRQRGLQRPGPPRLRPPGRLVPHPLHRARPARSSLPALPRPRRPERTGPTGRRPGQTNGAGPPEDPGIRGTGHRRSATAGRTGMGRRTPSDCLQRAGRCRLPRRATGIAGPAGGT